MNSNLKQRRDSPQSCLSPASGPVAPSSSHLAGHCLGPSGPGRGRRIRLVEARKVMRARSSANPAESHRSPAPGPFSARQPRRPRNCCSRPPKRPPYTCSLKRLIVPLVILSESAPEHIAQIPRARILISVLRP